jgi:RNA polymerase sigma-70 factor (ECF subfamily)
MSDATKALIQSAVQGDGASVNLLLDRYLPGLRAFIRLRTGAVVRAKESTSDLAQSVCREVLEHLDRYQYQGEEGFKYWLYTTALRKIADRHKYYGAEKRDAAREVRPGEHSAGPGIDQLVDCYRTVFTPSAHAMRREDIERLEAAFDQLPEDQREVISLAHIVGLSRAEIAQRMGRSDGAVRTLLWRGLATLAEMVDDRG